MILNLGGDVLSAPECRLCHFIMWYWKLKSSTLWLKLTTCSIHLSLLLLSWSMEIFQVPPSISGLHSLFITPAVPERVMCTPVPQVPGRGSRRPRARSDISAVFTIAAQSSSHHGPVSWLDIPALSTTFSRQLQQHQQQHSDPSEMSSRCIPKFIMVEIDTTVFILTYITIFSPILPCPIYKIFSVHIL